MLAKLAGTAAASAADSRIQKNIFGQEAITTSRSGIISTK